MTQSGSTASSLDSQDLFGMAAAMAEHMEHAVDTAKGLDNLPDRTRVENIVVLGLGASGVAGDILAATASPFVPVPINVVRGYEIPAYVCESSLVFAISYSGGTEETIEAATRAAEQGAKVVVVSSGGQLEELAIGWGAPHVHVLTGIPQARAAIGALTAPLFSVLEEMGLFPGASQWLDLAIDQVRERVADCGATGCGADAIATKLANKMVIVHGGGAIGAVAARRWKTQINENARTLAFFSEQPELCHNEIVSWDALSEWSRENVAIVALRHDDEHPQVMRRFDLTQDEMDGKVALIENLWASGEGTLAQVFDHIVLGDYVSLSMGVARGIDPGPLPFLSEMKAKLSSRS